MWRTLRLVDDRRRVAVADWSTSLTMWKPAGLRSTPETSPCFMPRTTSRTRVGNRAALRQPRLPPCNASGASENDAATCANSVPVADLRPAASSARRAALLPESGEACSGTRDQHVRQQVLAVAAAARRGGREELVDLGVGDVDAPFGLALAQPLEVIIACRTSSRYLA